MPAISRFYNTYRKEKHLNKDFDLNNLEKKLLLLNSFDPDSQSFTPTKKGPNEILQTSVTSALSTSTTTTTTTTTTTSAIASKISSSKKTTKLILNPPSRPKKRSRSSLESETNSVLVAKPVKVGYASHL